MKNMAGCTCENWTLQDLSSALQDMHKDNKRIVVPMFQRGKRWSRNQEQVFIDSLIKGLSLIHIYTEEIWNIPVLLSPMGIFPALPKVFLPLDFPSFY